MINKIIQGDCLEVLRTLPDESVDCVMTSPPYWGLRDYGVGGQIGQEPTFDEYITKLCDIFDEVKRALKKTGTCWVNMGDTYNSGGNYRSEGEGQIEGSRGRDYQAKAGMVKTDTKIQGLPDKCLCQIPSRFSIEMVNRGWILRNEIIWHKPNCMPESVSDRFTVDFEKLFFFVKSKKYYFEQQFEPMAFSSITRLSQDIDNQLGSFMANGGVKTNGSMKAVRPHGIVRNRELGYNSKENKLRGYTGLNPDGLQEKDLPEPDNIRNKRTVWKIETKGFSEAHFAVYPEKLCQTPVLAGCPEGGIVLDPFMGSGTTGKVVRDLGRYYFGIELNPEYIKIAEKRLAQQVFYFV